ncbi:MAG: Sec-independent protein translocase protein TatB [Deinococcota bacterium]
MRVGPLGIWEMLIILVVVLLVFGPRRLPEMAKGMGQAVREFRKGIRDMKDEIESEVSKDDSKETVSQSSEKTEAKSA